MVRPRAHAVSGGSPSAPDAAAREGRGHTVVLHGIAGGVARYAPAQFGHGTVDPSVGAVDLGSGEQRRRLPQEIKRDGGDGEEAAVQFAKADFANFSGDVIRRAIHPARG